MRGMSTVTANTKVNNTNNNWQLPPLDRILDLCRSRSDFPTHLNQAGTVLGKRRRSLVHEFLCDTEDPMKRRRAYSVDDNFQKVWEWKDSQTNVSQMDTTSVSTIRGMRRHSMFESSENLSQMHSSKKGVIRPWTVEEDNLLLAAVKTHGSQWSKVSEQLPDRNRRQCKEHWYRVLSKRPCARGIDPDKLNSLNLAPGEQSPEPQPAIFETTEDDAQRRGLWSADEDMQLLKAYEELGPRWPLIAKSVPGRNQRQCEKRYRRIKKSREEQFAAQSSYNDGLSALAETASQASQNSMILVM
ncbi:hypothetical protein HDV02_003563 [Globomyces sp. JEL0801]|nr:hypothetical protein HDV02_003563 [Globomyces sp. JEL0801]